MVWRNIYLGNKTNMKTWPLWRRCGVVASLLYIHVPKCLFMYKIWVFDVDCLAKLGFSDLCNKIFKIAWYLAQRIGYSNTFTTILYGPGVWFQHWNRETRIPSCTSDIPKGVFMYTIWVFDGDCLAKLGFSWAFLCNIFLKLHDIWHKFSYMYISVHNGVIELLHDLVVVWAGGMGLPLEQIDSYSLLHQWFVFRTILIRSTRSI